MKVTVKDLRQTDVWGRQLDLEVDAEDVESEITDELQKLRREVSLPGFRKGKAPLGQVRARFRKEVEAEVVERLVGKAVQQAIHDRELRPVATPRVDEFRYEEGKPLAFTARIDVRPDLAGIEYRGVRIEKVVQPVADEDVERLLERLRERRARLEPVERPVGAGDVVTVDLTALGPGQVPIVGSRREGIRLLVDEEGMPAPWAQALMGRRTGDAVVIAEPPPREREGRREAREAGLVETGGQERYDQLAIRQVEARHLPELDDTFAHEVARLDTLDELRGRVRADLEADEERRARREMERLLLDRIAAPLRLEIPERMVRMAADELFEAAIADYPDIGEGDRERLAVEAQKEAARRLRNELLLAEIGQRESISVSRQEADEELARLVAAGMEPPADKASRERVIEKLQDTLYDRKVLNFLTDAADVQVIERPRTQRRIVTPFDS